MTNEYRNGYKKKDRRHCLRSNLFSSLLITELQSQLQRCQLNQQQPLLCQLCQLRVNQQQPQSLLRYHKMRKR